MLRKDPKDRAVELSKLIGRPEARRLLCIEGVGPTTADRLVRGKYKPEVTALLAYAINRAFLAANKDMASA